MKKLGVVTWSSGINFGTGLQAFSLMRKLEDCGYSPVLVTRCYAEANLANYLISLGRILGLYDYWEDFKITQVLKRDLREYKPSKKTADWSSRNIKKTNIRFPFQYARIVNSVDCFITGSDQIWNSYVGFDPDMYLSFVGNKKRVAYASSIGTTTVNPKYASQIKTLLSRFAHIGVREETGVKALRELTGRQDVRQVLDPTLLIDKAEWHSIVMQSSPNVDITQPYIVCYLLGRHDNYHAQLNRVRTVTGISRVVVVPSNENRDFAPENTEIYDKADPFEFVKLIQNAAFVCTDSFHATAFSINLQKPFVEFLRFSNKDKESQNSRIYDLLQHYGLTNRLYADDSMTWSDPVDFTCVAAKLAEDRKSSLEFLKNAIEN